MEKELMTIYTDSIFKRKKYVVYGDEAHWQYFGDKCQELFDEGCFYGFYDIEGIWKEKGCIVYLSYESIKFILTIVESCSLIIYHNDKRINGIRDV